MGAKDYTELDCWQLSDRMRCLVSDILSDSAFRRDPELRGQLESAAESPCPNIAEGFARFQPRDFARFLRIAKGSQAEVIERLARAVAKKLVTKERVAEAAESARRAKGATTRLIVYLETAEPPNQRRRRGQRTRNPEPRNQNPEPGTPEPGT
jgi:four helix bundle protein